MEVTPENYINKSMIVLAREARGMAQRDLATEINMSPTNLSKIERGDIGVNMEIIKSIARATAFPLHFFSNAAAVIPENLSYRKRQTVSQKLIIPIHAQANIMRNHVQFLKGAVGAKEPDLPVLSVTQKQKPSSIAIKLRQRWNIPAGTIHNLVELVEKHGIPVVSFDFGTERIDSLSMLTDDRLPVIFLNKKLLGDKQRFSVAYELGKLIMHTFTEVGFDRDISSEANAFAAELLMPANEIKKDLDTAITIPLLATLKKKWKVSMIALLYRADDLGFLTPNQKKYLLQQFNTLNIRRREPMELDVPVEKERLLRKWIQTYRARTKLGMPEMAAVLYLHADELMELYFHD